MCSLNSSRPILYGGMECVQMTLAVERELSRLGEFKEYGSSRNAGMAR